MGRGGGHHKIGLVLGGSFPCISGSFPKINVQSGNIFFGLQKFQMLDIPDIFWVNSRYLAQACV